MKVTSEIGPDQIKHNKEMNTMSVLETLGVIITVAAMFLLYSLSSWSSPLAGAGRWWSRQSLAAPGVSGILQLEHQ